MVFTRGSTNLQLSAKLLLMNLMISGAFFLIACIIIVSFASVRNKSIEVTESSMESIITNSRTARELSEVFADIDLLNRTFYNNNEYLASEGSRLRDVISNILKNTTNLDLKYSLFSLFEKFDFFHSQCVDVNTVLHAIESIDIDTHKELTNFEKLIGEMLIDATLAGEDTSFITQQLTLVIGYQESMLNIAKLFAEPSFEIHSVTFTDKKSSVIAAINDLDLRLQTITASIPAVAKHGENIRNNLQRYKAVVLTFYDVMEELSNRRTALYRSKVLALTVLDDIDKNIATTAQQTSSSIDKVILSSGTIVLMLTILFILTIILVTRNIIKFNIRKPMHAILLGIESFSKGNFDTQIILDRKDEWNTIKKALNGMASDLHKSQTALQKANDELEDRVDTRTKELLAEKERAMVTLHSIGDAVISTDADGRVEYLNPVAEKLTGYSVEEAQGQSLEQIFHIINEETRQRVADPVARCLKEGKVIGLANHTVLVNKSGAEYAIQDSAAPILDPKRKILGVVLVFSDVTEARRLSRQISHQASHDALTGLINRLEFERRLKRVLETALSETTNNALCFLDLDQFKLVNDTCGHVAGDELLRQVSRLLQDNVRHRDTVARLGGDEFGLLMEHCSLKEAKQVASKLIKVVADYKFMWEDKHFKIGVSIGLVIVNELSANLNGVMSAADTACYMAKEQGRNRTHVYQEDDEELAKRHGEMQWAVRLPRALEENRLQLYFQPMAPVAINHVEGAHYEVLLRMADTNIVMPNAFFPAADRYNLTSRLDRWVINRAFQSIVDHPAHLESLYLCSINLSGHSLNDETFLEFVNTQFKKFPIPPEKICFEITETVAIANLSRANAFMKVLKEQGCRFSLDDFGSGLSSFAYLKNLPVDFLKIDGMFVKDMLEDSLDFAMVKSINEIGQVMGKQTIAEFVENGAIFEKLREIGIDYAQGYGIKRPRPLGEILE